MTQVSFLNGGSRLYGIVGDPIEQVRSPETVTWELQRRGEDALLVPLHVASDEFEAVFPALLRLRNLHGLVLTIPFKQRAVRYVQHLGAQASVMGAINVMARRPDGSWAAEMLDGMGCVTAFRQRGYAIAGKRLMLIGLGGAGGAIGAAMAAEHPRLMRIHDLDPARCERMASAIRLLSPETEVVVGEPTVDGVDVLLNASPVGMLDDARLPLNVQALPSDLIVFDAIVKPEQTPLLALAESCGCRIVRGREMMLGQIPRIVDFLLAQNRQGELVRAS